MTNKTNEKGGNTLPPLPGGNKTGNILLIIVVIIVALIFTYIFFFRSGVPGSESSVLESPAPGKEAEYQTLVEGLAKTTRALTVGKNCSMDPLVIQLKKGEPLTIRNTDTVPHVVAFEDNAFFSVSPTRSRTINIQEFFGKGAGIYRYKCNDIDIEDNVGVMYITD